MNETNAEDVRMTKKQKTTLIVLAMIMACLILTSLIVFWMIPRFMRSRFQLKYVELIQKYSEEYDLEPSFVAGVISTESKFKEEAVSRAGARGLMQIMPATGEEIAEALGVTFHVEDLFEPETSIRFGCYYLRQQLDRFDQNKAVALAAYNAGPNKAAQWLSEYGLDSRGRIAYIPYEETKNYVNRVLQAQENYENLYPTELAGITEE
ncbi:MAG: transglycosylase SLT domain-containing protein [Clostridia bacterium]|nr:transglycosylase SLT domain-containing protein [Clostridia bacterium]